MNQKAIHSGGMDGTDCFTIYLNLDLITWHGTGCFYYVVRRIIYLNLITGGKILHPSRVSSNRQAPTLENTVADMLDTISQVADHHVKNVVGKRRLSLQ